MCHHKAPHRPWQPDAKHPRTVRRTRHPRARQLLRRLRGPRAKRRRRHHEGRREHDSRPISSANPARACKGDALRKWAYQRYIKDYLRCVAVVDDNVGRLLDYLDAEGLAENTIVDLHLRPGLLPRRPRLVRQALHVRGVAAHAVPGALPGAIEPGTVNDDIVLNVDFAPTFLDFAGVEAPADMQGRSFRAAARGPHAARLAQGDVLPLLDAHGNDHRVPAHYGVRTERYKLIYYYGKPLGMKGATRPIPTPDWELFDLRNDPARCTISTAIQPKQV